MFNIMKGVPLTSVVRTMGSWCFEEEVYKAGAIAFIKNKNPSSLIKENELPYPTTDGALLNKKWYETFVNSINDLGLKQSVGQMREWREKNSDKVRVNRRRTPSGAVVSPELNLEKDQIVTKFEERNVKGNRVRLLDQTAAWCATMKQFAIENDLQKSIFIMNPPEPASKEYKATGGGLYMRRHKDMLATNKATIEDQSQVIKSMKRDLREAKLNIKANTNEMEFDNKRMKMEIKELKHDKSVVVTSSTTRATSS